jgi:hypothetical protein
MTNYIAHRNEPEAIVPDAETKLVGEMRRLDSNQLPPDQKTGDSV